jgi:transcription antitermination factor NusG
MGSKEWFIVFTKEGNEIKLATSLRKKGYTTFVPQAVPAHQFSSELNKPVTIFKKFVFIHCEPSALPVVKRVDGVLNLMYWLQCPVTVTQFEMDRLQEFVERNVDVQVVPKNLNAALSMELFLQADEVDVLELPSLLVRLQGSSRLKVIYQHSNRQPAIVA